MQKHLISMWRIADTCARSCVALMLAVVIFAPAASAPARAAFPEEVNSIDFSQFRYGAVVGSFHADVEVRADRSVRVIETLHTVFNEDRHGIFRDIPVIYQDNSGNRFSARFELESITLNGKPVPYERSWQQGQIRLKIGDPDVYVRNLQVYEITYVMHDVILFFDEYDEFYWNVTGTAWEMGINNPSVEIHFPAGSTVKQYACYTGLYGDSGKDCEVRANGTSVRAKGTQYLTVAVGIGKGIIVELTLAERIWSTVRNNWWGLIPLALLAWTFTCWQKYGRDPEAQTIVPEYEPPAGMNAAAVSMLHGRYKLKHVLTAMIVEMAMQGYLKMDVESKPNGKVKDITLTRLKDSTGLDERYADFFNNVLFKGDRASVTLKQIGKDQNGGKVLNIIQNSVVAFRRNVLFDKESLRRQALFVALGIFLTVASFFAILLGIFVAIATFVSGVGIFILGCLMRRRTPEGDERLRHVRGFHLFIKTAEAHRSEWQQKEGIFEKVLPFAIGFGLAQYWAKAFPDLQYQPTWYHGTVPFTVNGFATSMDSLSNRMSSNLLITPASSGSYRSGGGSSGGGFSGGGFGGGGGGSW